MANAIEEMYRQIEQLVRHRIESDVYSAGQRLPSETAFAKELGVSRTTVRRAYDELEREGLVKRTKGSGTYVSPQFSRALYTGPSPQGAVRPRRIGVVLPGSSEFFQAVYGGVLEGLKVRGYEHKLFLNTSKQAELEAFREVMEDGYDGIIVSPNRSYQDRTFENYKHLDKTLFPYVLIGKPPINIFCNAIYYDDVYGAYTATRYLYYRGCTRVLHVTNRTSGEFQSVNERIDGFTFAVKRYYETLDPVKQIMDMSSSLFVMKMTDALDTPQRVGILLYDDLMWPQVQALIGSLDKRVPEEVSMIGYNNLALCETSVPRLTSMNHDKHKMGMDSLELLDLRMARKNRQDVKHIINKPTLVVRESVC